MGGSPTGEIIRPESITGRDASKVDPCHRALNWVANPMEKMFSTLVRALLDGTRRNPPLAGFDVSDQFIPDRDRDTDVARNINAAFLILLSGKDHALYGAAEQYLHVLEGSEKWGNVAQFMENGATLVHGEIEALCRRDNGFRNALEEASVFCAKGDAPEGIAVLEKIWKVFFPEGVECLSNPAEKIASIRTRRQIHVTKPNVSPIDNPSRQILFLSNLLLTTPKDSDSPAQFPHDPALIVKLKQVMGKSSVTGSTTPFRSVFQMKTMKPFTDSEGLMTPLNLKKNGELLAKATD